MGSAPRERPPKIHFARNAECPWCLEFRPLLMPVAIETPYGGDLVRLCLWCRVGWRDDANATLATTFQHAPRERQRRAA